MVITNMYEYIIMNIYVEIGLLNFTRRNIKPIKCLE